MTATRTRLATLAACALAGLAVAASSSAGTASPTLVLTCHELEGGVPSVLEQRYTLRDGVLRNGDVFVSSTKYQMLTPYSAQTHTSAYAVHVIKGKKLYRDLYWKDRRNRTVRHFREVFDFGRQRIIEDGEDTCHHGMR